MKKSILLIALLGIGSLVTVGGCGCGKGADSTVDVPKGEPPKTSLPQPGAKSPDQLAKERLEKNGDKGDDTP